MPPVYPLVKIPSGERGHYQHMAKRDAELWERFLAGHAAQFVAFSYDVALGGVTIDFPGLTDVERQGWKYSTALKIDAVAWQPDLVWVIEVRPEATVSALGAALAYTLVAQRDKVFELPILPAVVCDAMQLDVRWACQQLGVHVEEIPL